MTYQQRAVIINESFNDEVLNRDPTINRISPTQIEKQAMIKQMRFRKYAESVQKKAVMPSPYPQPKTAPAKVDPQQKAKTISLGGFRDYTKSPRPR